MPPTWPNCARLSSLFLDRKEFSGAHGLQVSDDMAVAIAAQACLPVLRLGLRPYDGFVGIVVHPDEVQVRREFVDDDGVVHEYDDVLAGEAMEGGPVMLSWRDVSEAGESAELGLQRGGARVRACAGHGRRRGRRHPAAAGRGRARATGKPC